MRIAKIPGQIVESALSIVGIRIGTEEPHYLRQPLTDAVEVRRYGPRIAAETTVDEERTAPAASASAVSPTTSSGPTIAKRRSR